VDDCLFLKEENDIMTMIESLRKPEATSFDLNIEDDVAGFLGTIFMNQSKDGSIELNQSGLVDCILKVIFDESHERLTPADQRGGLGKHEESDSCCF
jgi:hypothetical protein